MRGPDLLTSHSVNYQLGGENAIYDLDIGTFWRIDKLLRIAASTRLSGAAKPGILVF
jgi:hypothetical protein